MRHLRERIVTQVVKYWEMKGGTITKLELETHDAAVLRKRLELSGVNALLATWAPYAQREVDSGDKWGDASNTVRRLKARQRSIKMQLLYMGEE